MPEHDELPRSKPRTKQWPNAQLLPRLPATTSGAVPAEPKPAKPPVITLDAGKFDIEVKEEKSGDGITQSRKNAKETIKH